MKTSSHRLRWLVAIGLIVALAISLRHSINRQREIGNELARIERAAAELMSPPRHTRPRQSSAHHPTSGATIMDDRSWRSEEQRQRDILERLDQIQPTPTAEPRPPFPSATYGSVYFYELMDTPGYNEKVRAYFLYDVNRRYGRWLQSIASPERRAKAEKLLLEQQLIGIDAGVAALPSGVDLENNSIQVMRLRQNLGAAERVELRTALGESEHARYVHFITTLTRREALAPVATRLSYSEEPLTPEQIDRIVALMPDRGYGPRSGQIEQPIDEALKPAKAVFSLGQWKEVEEFVRDGGTLRP